MNRIISLSTAQLQANYLAYLCSLGYILVLVLLSIIPVQAFDTYPNKMMPSMRISLMANDQIIGRTLTVETGEEVSFFVSVTNTGNSILQILNITDSELPGPELRLLQTDGDQNNNGLVDIDEIWTISYKSTVSSSEIHLVSVLARAVDDQGQAIIGEATIIESDQLEVLVNSEEEVEIEEEEVEVEEEEEEVEEEEEGGEEVEVEEEEEVEEEGGEEVEVEEEEMEVEVEEAVEIMEEIELAEEAEDENEQLVEETPEIRLVKQVVGAPGQTFHQVARGGSVQFEYFIENTGTTDLGTITLIDNPHGNILIQGRLENGELLGGDEDDDGILDQQETWHLSFTVEDFQQTVTSIGVVNANPVFEDGRDIPNIENPTDSDITIVEVIENGSVSGIVYQDIDADSIGDMGVAQMDVLLIDADNQEQEVTTADDGTFLFDDVIAGPYTLSIKERESYIPVVDSDGSDPSVIRNNLASGMTNESDFFVLRKLSQSVSGFVLEDIDGDDIGDIAMANVMITIELEDDESSVFTDDTGFYEFQIPPGEFELREEDQDGFASVADAQGKNNNKIKGEVGENQNLQDLNFINARFASVSGLVMADLNADGIEDSPIADAVVYMIDREDDEQSMRTNADGSFSFEIVPGEFTIIEKDPEGFRSLGDADGANDNMISDRALPGQELENKNFTDALIQVNCALDVPVLSVIDNDCDAMTEGSIMLTSDCDPIATTEFSVDNGQTWSTTLPTYDPINSISILARCIDTTISCVPESFDFESLASSEDPVADISQAGLQANGITLVSLSVVNNGSASQDDFEISDDHLPGTFGPKLGVENADGIENNQTATYTFSEPISNFCVTINDLDQNDAVEVNGSLSGADPILLTVADVSFPFGDSACPTFIGNNTFQSQCFGNVGNVKNSVQGAVTVCFPSPVDQIDFLFYDWNGTGGGSYTVSRFETCVEQDPCISDTLSLMTNPVRCCVVPSSPELAVIDNSCNPVSQGTFLVTTDCPVGTQIEYSVDAGETWTQTIPEYPTTSQTLIARCVDPEVENCISAISSGVVANPEICNSCIDIVKSSLLDLGADRVANPGDVISYAYNVTNCGTVLLTGVTVTEPELQFSGTGNLPIPSSLNPSTLSPGEEGLATATYIITQQDIDNGIVINQAIVTGTNPENQEISANSDSGNAIDADESSNTPTTTPIQVESCIELIESGVLMEGEDGIATIGDSIVYTYTITNCGNTTLSDVNLTQAINRFSGSGNMAFRRDNSSMTIAPGEQSNVTATYRITQEDIDAGGVTNQAIVSAVDSGAVAISDESDSDDPALLGPNDPSFTVLVQIPCVELIKTSTLVSVQNGFTVPGDQINYNFEIINCGNVTLTNLSLVELLASFTGTNGLPQVSALSQQIIAPGNAATATATYNISQQDINAGTVTNQALAAGTGPLGDEVSDDDQAVTVLPQVACIQLVKSSAFDTGIFSDANPGDIINYSYEVTNCGGVILNNVMVSELQTSFTGTNPLPTILNSPNLSLNPGETTTLQAMYQISQADIDAGVVTNQASASGDSPDGMSISDLSDSGNSFDENNTEEDPTNTFLEATPCVELIKSSTYDLGNNNQSDPGDLIRYTYTVRNCGQMTLSNIIISESPASFSGTGPVPVLSAFDPLVLAPGEQGQATAFYFVTQADIDNEIIFNQATVTAESLSGIQVSDISDSDNVLDGPGSSEDPTETALGNCDVLACNQDLNISLDESCSLVLTPDLLLENAPENGAFVLAFSDNDGNFLRNDTLFASDAIDTIRYQIFCGGNSCWGTLNLEVNIIPEIPAPCACNEDGSISDDCIFWCGSDMGNIIVSPEEALDIFTQCGPRLLGDISVTTNTTGELCDTEGEIREIIYSAKIIRHGVLEDIELLCQRYGVQKLDLDVSDDVFAESFGFPRDVQLDCDYLDDIDVTEGIEFGNPASIFAATGSGSLAYSFFIDRHSIVDQIRIDTLIEHVEVDTMIRQDIVMQDIDGDGQPEWVLATIVDKIFEEQLVFDTIVLGQTNPEVPLFDQVCNIQASFADLTFELCGTGTKIVRDWTILDWCDSRIQRSGTQNIYIKDSTAPEVRDTDGNVVSDLSDVVTIINPWECTSNIRLPELSVQDDCSTDIQIEWSVHDLVIEDGFILDVTPAISPVLVEGIVRDECDNETRVNFSAIVRDDVAPVVVCESSVQVVLTVDPNTGEAVAKVPASQFDIGSNDLSCGEVSFTVVREEDWSEQLFNCNGERVGFLPVSCGVRLDTLTLDASNAKDCLEETVLISRPTDFVEFCCEDAGKVLGVILIVTDESGNRNSCRIPVEVLNNIVPQLKCEDQTVDCTLGDTLEKPSIISNNCLSEGQEIELLSEAATDGVCNGGTIIREWFIDMDRSNTFNDGDAYCRQRLLINNGESFDPATIQWPQHYDGSAHEGVRLSCNDQGESVEENTAVLMGDPMICFPESTIAKPIWCESSCNLIGYTMEVDTIDVDFVCSQIIRTWTVIDWCTFDPNGVQTSEGDSFVAVNASGAEDCIACTTESGEFNATHWRYDQVNPDGFYNFDQVIYIQDNSAPDIVVEESITSMISAQNETKEDSLGCTGTISLTANGSDICGATETSAAQLRWTIQVFLGVEVIADSQQEGGTATIEFEGVADVSYRVEWTLSDGCGNSSTVNTEVSVIDDLAPTPICIFGATTRYSIEEGEVEIWAQDLDFGSFDNCTSTEELRFTIIRPDEMPIRPEEDGFEDQQVINFNCEDVIEFQELNVWVWDRSGNGAFCATSLTIGGLNVCEISPPVDTMMVDTMIDVDTMVVDTMMMDVTEVDTTSADSNNMDTVAMASSFVIAGDIYTYYNEPINQVIVGLQSPQPEYPQEWTTFEEGHYAFDSNPESFNYTLSAQKEDVARNGLSTLDLVMISRHIIGEEEFRNPYQIIAGDVNGDGRLSAVDLSELKRIVLGVSDEFRNLDNWLFVREDFRFLDESNPWPFEENIDIQELDNHLVDEDFIAIKIGDVNETIRTSNASSPELRNRSPYLLSMEDQYVTRGQDIELTVRVTKGISSIGMQLEFQHEGLVIDGIASYVIQIEDEDVLMTKDFSRVIWFDQQLVDFAEGEQVITLHAKAMTNGYVSDMIQISAENFDSEIYVGDYFEEMNVQLTFASNTDNFTELMNAPNPFVDQTTIYFESAKNGTVIAKLNDSSGRLLWTRVIEVTKGNNQLTLTGEYMREMGIHLLTLTDDRSSKTIKMLRLKK